MATIEFIYQVQHNRGASPQTHRERERARCAFTFSIGNDIATCFGAAEQSIELRNASPVAGISWINISTNNIEQKAFFPAAFSHRWM